MVEKGCCSHFIDASYGSIYPALARMLREGLVRVRTEDDGSGRPPRKVYTITEKGRAELQRALSTDPAPDKFKSEFLFQMLFLERIDHEHLAVIYDAYLEEQEAELRALEEEAGNLPQHPGTRFVQDFGRAMLGTAIAFLKKRRAEMLRAFAEYGGTDERPEDEPPCCATPDAVADAEERS